MRIDYFEETDDGERHIASVEDGTRPLVGEEVYIRNTTREAGFTVLRVSHSVENFTEIPRYQYRLEVFVKLVEPSR
jgi:hypothetical protein